MILSESQIRSIVRAALLKEQSYLDTKIETSEYITIGKSAPLKVIGTSTRFNLDAKPHYVFLAPSKLSAAIENAGGGIVKGDKVQIDTPAPTVYNPSLINNLKVQPPLMIPPRVYHIPSDAQAVKVKKGYVDSSANADVDIAIEALSMVGLIPALGTPADLLTVILAIIKKDPLLAAVCILSSAPVMGFLGPALKKAIKGKKTDEAIKSIVDTIKSADVDLSGVIAPASQFCRESFKELKASVNSLSEATGMPASEVRDIYYESEKIVNKIFDNLSDVTPKSSKASPLSGSQLTQVRNELTNTFEDIIASMRSGIIRSTSEKSISILNKRLVQSRKDLWQNLLNSAGPDFAINKNLFFAEASKHLVGKEIKVANRTVVFKNQKVFEKEMRDLWASLETPMSLDDFLKLKIKQISEESGILEKYLNFNELDSQILLEKVISNFENMKLNLTNSPTEYARTAFPHFIPAGYMSKSGDDFYVDMSRIVDVDDLRGLLEHEIQHFIDGQLLVGVLASVKPWQLKNIPRNYLSNVRAFDSLLKVDDALISPTVFEKLGVSAYKLTHLTPADYNKLVDIQKKATPGMPSKTRSELHAFLKSLGAEFPVFHVDYISSKLSKMPNLKRKSVPPARPGGSPPSRPKQVTQLKSLEAALSYDASPIELVPGLISTAKYAKKIGYDLTKGTDEIMRFLKEVDYEKVRLGGTHSTEADVYKYFYDIAKTNDSAAAKTAVEYFASILGN